MLLLHNTLSKVAMASAMALAALSLVPAQYAAAATSTATTETVYYWNEVLLEAFRRQGGAPTPLARAAAIMNAGIFDVLNSARWSRQGGTGAGYREYLLVNIVTSNVDDDLAAGMAARDLLITALPQQKTFVQRKYTERHGTASQQAATSLADSIVSAMKEARANDGSGSTAPYTGDDVPGSWRPTGNGCTTAATPQFGQVRPFVMSSTSQFRQPLPGGFQSYASLLSSSLYAANVNEVKAIGSSNSTQRTATQTQTALFWANDLDGTYKPPGQLLNTTRIVAAGRMTNAVGLSRLYAQVSLALADAGIAAWDEKYDTRIDLWRPETAIQQADTDNNSATVPIKNWRPLSMDASGVHFSPCFPAWVSGHATFAAAWAGVMRTTFGDDVLFTATTEDPNADGVTRSFSSFTAAATQNAQSRVFLGVHYQFDADDGLTTGYGVASLASRELAVIKCNDVCYF